METTTKVVEEVAITNTKVVEEATNKLKEEVDFLMEKEEADTQTKKVEEDTPKEKEEVDIPTKEEEDTLKVKVEVEATIIKAIKITISNNHLNMEEVEAPIISHTLLEKEEAIEEPKEEVIITKANNKSQIFDEIDRRLTLHGV